MKSTSSRAVFRRSSLLSAVMLLVFSGSTLPAQAAENSYPDTRAEVSVTANGNFQLVFTGNAAQVVGQVLPVEPTADVPTGTVELLPEYGETPLGSTELGNNILSGLFVLIAPPLELGTHYFRAAYSGDENFAPKTIRFPIVVLSGPETKTALSLSPAGGSVSGQLVTMTAQVSALDGALTGAPLGEVTFMVDGVELATVPAGAGWQAVFSTTALAVGTHSISAAYQHQPGDYFPSVSPALSYPVSAAKALIRTEFHSSRHGDIPPGTSVTTQAVVAPRLAGGPMPTGWVQFFDWNSKKGAPVKLVNGKAWFVYSGLGSGKHVLQAQYLGSALYVSGFTPARTVTVTTVPVTTVPVTQ